MLKKIVVFALLLLCNIPCIASAVSLAAFKLPDTGHTLCFQAYTSSTSPLTTAIPCAGTGQDGAYNINPMSYTDNGDQTITDNNTGLTWSKLNNGSPANLANASAVCASLNLGGHTGWRLPTEKELMSIVDYSIQSVPTINQTIFPTTVSDVYWSSTSAVGHDSSAWYVDFSEGIVAYTTTDNTFYVRCVYPTGQSTKPDLTDNGDQTITDNNTGLMWQQGEQGSLSWGDALNSCKGSYAGYSDWRLPNIKELESLADDTQSGTMIDSTYFPDGESSNYWSSTTLASNQDHAWSVSFSDGYVGPNSKFVSPSYQTEYVRCVRGGQVRISNFDDFDGDNKTETAVFRRSTGRWYIINSYNGVQRSVSWGQKNGNDIPVPGDYDGDGKTDIAIFRPSNGNWYIISSSTGAQSSVQWGQSGDVPVPGDYDGDGKTDKAVFRPSEGKWYFISSSTGAQSSVQWGQSGDLPVPGDYDGDGMTDIAVFRPSEGKWYIISSSTGAQYSVQWGQSGDVPVPGDYEGNGKTDIAVFRPSEGKWYIISSTTGAQYSVQWGQSGDIPVPGDYDGDGITDIAVFRPSEGKWYIISSSTGTQSSVQWGQSGDIPVNQQPLLPNTQ
jgi:predicted CoA-binding protein